MGILPQESEQFTDGTQRSDDPVSKLIRNGWAGVPMEMTPAKYACEKSRKG